MDSRTDRVLKPLRVAVVFLYLIAIVTGTLGGWLTVRCVIDGGSNFLGPSIVLASGGYVGLLAWKLACLCIAEGHVRYRTWFQVRELRWCDVSRLEVRPTLLILHSRSQKASIPPGAFADAAAVRRRVISAIAEASLSETSSSTTTKQ